MHRDELRVAVRPRLRRRVPGHRPRPGARCSATLAGDGGDLTVVGDPHQSIYAFRGAEVRGILDFPEPVPQPRRRARPTSSPSRASAASAPGCSRPASGSPRRLAADRQHRRRRRARAVPRPGGRAVDGVGPAASRCSPTTPSGPRSSGSPTCCAAPTSRTACAWSRDGRAGALGAHLDPRPAARAGRRRGAGRGRQRRDPAGARARRAAPARRAAGGGQPRQRRPRRRRLPRPGRRRGAAALRRSVGLDATDVRALSRALRERDKALAAEPRAARRGPRRSCCARRCSDGGELRAGERRRTPVVRAGGRPGRGCCAGARRAARRRRHRRGGALGAVVGHRLARAAAPRASTRGGPAARLAHRDLDAVCALFETAARAEEQRGHTSVDNFLATLVAQEIPADTLAERGVRGERRAAADRPPLQGPGVAARRGRPRPGGGLARPASARDAAAGRPHRRRALRRAGARSPTPPPASCSPRSAGSSTSPAPAPASGSSSRRWRSPDDDGEQPSRFLDELGVEVRHEQGRPPRPLSLPGLVAELRRTAADPGSTPTLRAGRRPPARPAGAARPARRTRAGAGRRPGDLVGDPRPEPRRPAGAAAGRAGPSSPRAPWPAWSSARPSGSSSARPAAPRKSSQAQGFGNVVHAIADRVAKGELEPAPRRRRRS